VAKTEVLSLRGFNGFEMRVLVVKLSSIGDIVHCLPAVAAIKAHGPEVEITWVAERRSSDLLVDSPAIDRLIRIETRFKGRASDHAETLKALFSNLRTMRRSHFDLAIDFQGLMKSAVIARASGAKKVWGFGKDSLRESESRIFLNNTVEAEGRHHVVVKNMILAEKALGFNGPRRDFSFPISLSSPDFELADGIAAKSNSGFAILNPAGGWVTKLWSPESFGKLSDQLLERTGLRSVVTVGPGEIALGERVRRAARNDSVICVSPDIKSFHALAKKAQIYIGGDTGPTHIAVAAGTRVVGIFGPTEWWRNGSVNPLDVCVERNDIDCRENCHRRTCGKWICMDISPERVAEAAIARLGGE